jgi:hypothetical protein
MREASVEFCDYIIDTSASGIVRLKFDHYALRRVGAASNFKANYRFILTTEEPEICGA